jgi:hypothetical protein
VALALAAYGAGWVHGEHSGMHGRKAQRRQQVLAKRAGEHVRDALHEARVRGAKADDVMRQVREREVEVERRERAVGIVRHDETCVHDDAHWTDPGDLQPYLDAMDRAVRNLGAVTIPPGVFETGKAYNAAGFIGVVGIDVKHPVPGEHVTSVDLGDLAAGVDPAPSHNPNCSPWCEGDHPPAPTEADLANEAARRLFGSGTWTLHAPLSDVEQAVAAGFPPSPDDPQPYPAEYEALRERATVVWRLPEDDEPGEPEDDPRMEALREARAEQVEPVTEDDVAQAAADLAALEPENDERAREVLGKAYEG